MDVMASASKIGLTRSDGVRVHGTIDEEIVLAALLDLELEDAQNSDLYTDAAFRVRLARSGGVERIEAGSIFARRGQPIDIKLRYRAEMAEILLDLAIDVGIRQPQPANATV